MKTAVLLILSNLYAYIQFKEVPLHFHSHTVAFKAVINNIFMITMDHILQCPSALLRFAASLSTLLSSQREFILDLHSSGE